MENKYEVVIGLEIHSQLNTVSKMFCGCDNQSFAEATDGKQSEQVPPNSLTCPVCMGMPGTLPVINKKALEWTYLLGLALGCEIPNQFNFERKQYFYPDLPKAYQITSQTTPPLVGGWLELEIPSATLGANEHEMKKFTIEHVHLEEDAGKLVHSGDHSLVDLNRAGTPLLEIVTNPDFRSPVEAKLFMQELQRILRYLGISSADMEKGHLRCDANISLREFGAEKLGKKVEIKNMNSFSSLERALEFEIKRQTEMLDNGEVIEQETRGWDDAKGITTSQRSKEMAHDYRYFPEPDLPPIVPAEAFALEELRKQIPELPAEKRTKYLADFGLGKTETDILVSNLELAKFFEEAVGGQPKEIAKKIGNWVLGEVSGYLNERAASVSEINLPPANLRDLVLLIEKGDISSKIAKDVFLKMVEGGKSAAQVIESEGIKQVSDTGELEGIINEIIANNPAQVEEYRGGKVETLNWFVGQVMKATRGQANPGVVMEVLKKLLSQ